MILSMMAIRDAKSELFSQPMFYPAIGQAVRDFSDAVNDEKSGYHRHPEDYSLWHLGNFVDTTGELIPLPAPSCITLAVNVTTQRGLALS